MRRILVVLATMVAGVLLASGVALAAVVDEVEPNDSIAGAQDIAAASFDLTENADIEDSTEVLHATVNGTGTAPETFDYYSFTVPEGDPVRVILDIDHTTLVTPSPPPDESDIYDSWIELYDSSGTFLADSDDDSGDPGSTTDDPFGRDSFIQTTLDPGTYYVAVGRFTFDDTSSEFMGEVPDTATYQLHVSVGDDTTPPDTTITDGPTNGSLVNPGFATFSFSADDNSTFKCRLDDQVEFTTCDSPITYTGLSVESHTFEVQATDDDGNVETESASRTWFVSDVTAPTVQSTTPLDGATKVSRTDPNITATFSEAMATIPPNAIDLQKLRVQGQRVSVIGEVSFTLDQSDPTVLSIKPAVTLDKGSYYRVSINSAATDEVGNLLESAAPWRFKTAPK